MQNVFEPEDAARERDALPRSCGSLRRVTRLQLACVALAAPGGVAAERACPPALLATHWS